MGIKQHRPIDTLITSIPQHTPLYDKPLYDKPLIYVAVLFLVTALIYSSFTLFVVFVVIDSEDNNR
jgi:hypothetical protein